MPLKKWKLLSTVDASPSNWLPIEKRTYELPDGRIVDDFFVITLADSVHVIALTPERKVLLVRMFKQGTDDFMTQFPAGRFESKHSSKAHAAVSELAEETGVIVSENDLQYVGKLSLMSTKATELAHYFFVNNAKVSSLQKLDDTEEIEVLFVSPTELDQMIVDGIIWDAPCIAGWELTKKRFPQYF